jgi:F-type H+-transporting ATPase subunit b
MIQDILGQLGFDWKVALANLVNFLIIFYLLRNVVFRKIAVAIKERQEKIQKGIDDAKVAESAKFVAEVEKQAILKEAHLKSRQIVEKAELDKENTLKEARLLAEKQAEEIKAGGRKESARYIEEAEKKLKIEYVDMVIDGIEKTAVHKIDKKSSEQFIQSLI